LGNIENMKVRCQSEILGRGRLDRFFIFEVIRNLDIQSNTGLRERGDMPVKTLDEIFEMRYSCRSYELKSVSEGDLTAICEAARLAPSACNSQTWRFVVVQDRSIISKICDEAMRPVVRNRWMREAPVLIVGCSKLDILANKIGSAVTGIEYYQIDLGIAMEHMVLKATELGLGTCWIGWFREDRIKEILGIPGSIRVSALLAVGYPGKGVSARKKKKSLAEIVSRDRWGAR